jgi:hypothetical protein
VGDGVTWLRVLLTIWLSLSVIVVLSQIDQPRKPLSAGAAILSTIFTIGFIWSVWIL